MGVERELTTIHVRIRRIIAERMRSSLVVTIIGDDRPGIVEQLADHVLAAGANWEESRMARLAGKFAGLLRVSVDADRTAALAANLRRLEAHGLRVVAEPGGDAGAGPFRTFGLELVGSDHPGIVRDISRALARHRVNIEELETEVTSAPMSGETLFRARARLQLPATVTVDTLRGVLEALAADLVVDLTISGEDGAAPDG
jgi:glycine cleavage system regulatory protein